MVKPPESRKNTSQKRVAEGGLAIGQPQEVKNILRWKATTTPREREWCYDAFVYLGVWFLNGTKICTCASYAAVFMYNMSVRFTKKSVLCNHLSPKTLHCDMSATHRNFMQSTLPLELEAGRPACDYCFVRVCFSDIHFPPRINKFASKTHVWSFQMIQMHPNAPNSHLFTHINISHSRIHHGHPVPPVLLL